MFTWHSTDIYLNLTWPPDKSCVTITTSFFHQKTLSEKFKKVHWSFYRRGSLMLPGVHTGTDKISDDFRGFRVWSDTFSIWHYPSCSRSMYGTGGGTAASTSLTLQRVKLRSNLTQKTKLLKCIKLVRLRIWQHPDGSLQPLGQAQRTLQKFRIRQHAPKSCT